MKEKLIFYLCMALFPYMIYAADSSSDEACLMSEIVEQMDEMAEEGKLINNNFRPSKNGFLGEGAISFTYKGVMIRPITREVAMKFTLRETRDAFEEFEIYTYLGSLHVPNIESYGIPKVLFFGRWEKCMMMAITMLDSEFKKRSEAGLGSKKLNEVDILIAFREFVRITKYIHSKNICHNDIHVENLMFRRDRAFIIDYNLAFQMFKHGNSGENVVLLPNDNAERRIFARADWKKFLFSMCQVVGVQLAWFNEEDFYHLSDNEAEAQIEQLKQDAPAIMNKIREINFNGLRRIFDEFAGLVFEDKIQSTNREDKVLFYDYFDRIIREEITKLNPPNPVMVSWLTSDQRNAAIRHLEHELQTNTTLTISSVPNPFRLVKIEYPPVNYLHFFNKRPSPNTGESSGSKKSK